MRRANLVGIPSDKICPPKCIQGEIPPGKKEAWSLLCLGDHRGLRRGLAAVPDHVSEGARPRGTAGGRGLRIRPYHCLATQRQRGICVQRAKQWYGSNGGHSITSSDVTIASSVLWMTICRHYVFIKKFRTSSGHCIGHTTVIPKKKSQTTQNKASCY